MNTPSRLSALLFLSVLALAGCAGLPNAGTTASTTETTVTATDALQKSFVAPPMEARPMVRWWWFGPAVTKAGLEREMNTMKAGGFGGFEVQPTYPLATDGQYPGLVNLKFLSPEFFDMLGFTAARAKDLGLRMDLTLGSGWPYGGPMITRSEAAQSLGQGITVTVSPGQATVSPNDGAGAAADAAPVANAGGGAAPDLAAAGPGGGRGGRRGAGGAGGFAGGGGRGGRGAGGGPLVAALLGPVTDAAPGASPYIALKIDNGAAQLPANLHGATQVTFYTARENIMAVKRPAYGAEGPVVDHYGPAALKKFIDQIALPEINACGPNAPYSLFCDSLEINGEGWTPTYLTEFQKRRGYDLTPMLPALYDNTFPKAAEIRADYGHTLVDIFVDNFVKTFEGLAKDHNSRFRIQAYGGPPTTLATYQAADLDEGESYNNRTLSGTRWASSASHVLGRPVASAEAFTWSHDPVFNCMPIDIKAEANLDFLNGINSFCCHGWPYNADGVEYPGWHFYVSAIFNDRNPWWIAMPDLTNYLARSAYLLRQGQPANDVAIYLPEEDAYTGFSPNNVAMVLSGGGGYLNPLVSYLVPTILDSGYNFDVMDDSVIASRAKVDGNTFAFGDVKYKVVIVPNVTRIPLATLKKFQDFADHGGILIATDSLPSQAPGYLATAADHQAVKDLSAKIFTAAGAKGINVPSAQLGNVLQSKLRPDVAYSKARSDIGVIHRHTDGGELYFIVNTSNVPVSETAIFRVDGLSPEWWDPVTGRVTPETNAKTYTGATGVSFSLPAYGSQFLIFTHRKLPAPPIASGPAPAPLDLSKDWNVTFKNSSKEADPAPEQFTTLSDWSTNPATASFSGVATYEKQVEVPASMLQPGIKTSLYFGEDQPANVGGFGGGGHMTAALTAPIGDVAVVWVNGQRAGAAWSPPYSVDVTSLLKPGANQIRIQVANRAINYLSAHAETDMESVKADPRLGGNRYSNQNMSNVRPLPSGLLTTVQLVASAGK